MTYEPSRQGDGDPGLSPIRGRIFAAVADVLGCEPHEITMGAALTDDLGADSLDRLELSLRLEEEFGLVIPDSDGDALSTVDDLVRYVEARTAAV